MIDDFNLVKHKLNTQINIEDTNNLVFIFSRFSSSLTDTSWVCINKNTFDRWIFISSNTTLFLMWKIERAMHQILLGYHFMGNFVSVHIRDYNDIVFK